MSLKYQQNASYCCLWCLSPAGKQIGSLLPPTGIEFRPECPSRLYSSLQDCWCISIVPASYNVHFWPYNYIKVSSLLLSKVPIDSRQTQLALGMFLPYVRRDPREFSHLLKTNSGLLFRGEDRNPISVQNKTSALRPFQTGLLRTVPNSKPVSFWWVFFVKHAACKSSSQNTSRYTPAIRVTPHITHTACCIYIWSSWPGYIWPMNRLILAWFVVTGSDSLELLCVKCPVEPNQGTIK